MPTTRKQKRKANKSREERSRNTVNPFEREDSVFEKSARMPESPDKTR